MFAVLSLRSRPHLQVRRDQVVAAQGARFHFPPRRTVPEVSGLSFPWGFCGLVAWLVKPILLLNSAQKLPEDLPREEKNGIGERGIVSAWRTLLPPFPTQSPGHGGGGDLNIWNLVARKKTKRAFHTKGTLPLVRYYSNSTGTSNCRETKALKTKVPSVPSQGEASTLLLTEPC